MVPYSEFGCLTDPAWATLHPRRLIHRRNGCVMQRGAAYLNASSVPGSGRCLVAVVPERHTFFGIQSRCRIQMENDWDWVCEWENLEANVVPEQRERIDGNSKRLLLGTIGIPHRSISPVSLRARVTLPRCLGCLCSPSLPSFPAIPPETLRLELKLVEACVTVWHSLDSERDKLCRFFFFFSWGLFFSFDRMFVAHLLTAKSRFPDRPPACTLLT
ncbi:hypothetical protein B0T20DRAFT_113934 [Sordaria brevicollis]|uniref:Uncharacterized protein n=1 Tax=Sordaria brevicollis TaxID=83679 RepID=A0AAE0UFD3_SORBR|nr:hypothetical protein B0T20DRAFT_113934 [Sordaria brevicollis]